MNRIFLVARREFFEHLRTKTFWIGIFSFPVILLLAILVPTWLEGKVDVRKYAVLDKSGWLLGAVEEKANVPDLAKVFMGLKEAFRKGGKALEIYPPFLRAEPLGVALGKMNEGMVEKLGEVLSMIGRPEGAGLLEKAGLPPEMETLVGRLRAEIGKWWRSLPPSEAKKVAPGSAKSRYRRIPLEDLGNPDEAGLRKLVDKGKLFAGIVIGPDPVHTSLGSKYFSKNLADIDLKRWFERFATEAVREVRVKELKLSPEKAAWLMTPLRIETLKVTEGGGEEKASLSSRLHQLAPVAFVYILWISIFMIAQMLLTSTIEEKSNRVIEVLLSSVSPVQLMAGKIIGPALTGLTMILAWAFFALVGLQALPLLVENVPDLGLGAILSDPAYLFSFIVYFLLGYLLYASLLVGIGSVCNSLKEAQNLMQPITLVLIVPLLAMIPVVKDPNGTLARVLSFIPPFTPFVMMNRVAGPPAAWEYAATTILLLGTLAFTVWAAAKIFRVGILMTGKPPKLREILRWVREDHS